jgi:small GTP-binding protein
MNKLFEYIIVGPPEVGKTSLIIRYFDNVFINKSYNTIGIDMKHKYIYNFANYNIKLRIYDTAGQERFFPLVTNFIKNKNCILLCFSLASSHSFEECKVYSKMIQEIKDDNSIVILVGTFLDMKNKCKNIDMNDIKNFAEENNYKYFEISSKTGEGIRELFDQTLKIMIDNDLGKPEIENNKVILNTNPLKILKCC